MSFFFFQAEDGIRDYKVTGVQTCAFFFQAEDGIRDYKVTGVQTCALPICGRIHPPGTGYAPGLIVLNEYMPFSSVRASPKPRKFGSFGAGFGSATWTYRPFALACQISTMAPLTGRHSSSVARPVT